MRERDNVLVNDRNHSEDMRVDQRIETINIKGMEWEVRIGGISHQ
jgi:hypothetical protein